MNLSNKNIVIVGATGGIGSEIVKTIAAKGGTKMILIGRDVNKLEKLREIDESIVYYETDIASEKNVSEVANDIIKKFKKIDILINAAGIGIYHCLEETTLEEMSKSMSVNVLAPFLLIKSLSPALNLSESPVIINLGSGMGTLPYPGRIPYCTSKFALRGFSLSLSREYSNTKFKCCLITLGSTLTEFGPLSLEDKKNEEMQGKPYLTPEWVGKKIIDIIEKDEIEEEIELFPSDYVDNVPGIKS